MSDIINNPVLVSAMQDLARGIKSEADLSSLTRELLKITVEASLNAEMEAHPGYPKHSPECMARPFLPPRFPISPKPLWKRSSNVNPGRLMRPTPLAIWIV